MVLFLSSCNEDNSINNVNKDNNSYLFSVDYVNLWNPINHLDSIGFYHNMILDYSISNSTTIPTTQLPYHIDSIIYSSASNNYNYVYNLDSNRENNDLFISELQNSILNNDTFYDYLGNNFSQNTTDTLISLFELMKTCDDFSKIEYTIQKIKILEMNVYANAGFTNQEKNIILSSTSVAKFSIVYWADTHYNTNNPWYIWAEDYRTEMNDTPMLIGWVSAAFADVVKVAIEVGRGNEDIVDIAAKSAVSSAFGYIAGTAETVGNFIGGVIGTVISWFGF